MPSSPFILAPLSTYHAAHVGTEYDSRVFVSHRAKDPDAKLEWPSSSSSSSSSSSHSRIELRRPASLVAQLWLLKQTSSSLPTNAHNSLGSAFDTLYPDYYCLQVGPLFDTSKLQGTTGTGTSGRQASIGHWIRLIPPRLTLQPKPLTFALSLSLPAPTPTLTLNLSLVLFPFLQHTLIIAPTLTLLQGHPYLNPWISISRASPDHSNLFIALVQQNRGS